MTNDRATESQLNELHGLLAETLIDQIKAFKAGRLVQMEDGEYTKVFPAALLEKAAKFLKDNGIDSPRRAGNPVDRLAKIMPDFDAVEAGSPH